MNSSNVQLYLQKVSRPAQPMASLIVPLYNQKHWLPQFLQCCLAFDTLIPYELIFIDNNSTDGSKEFLKDLSAKVLKQPIQGVNHARQLGLEHARGQVIVSMDADTCYPPNFINEMVLPLYEFPEASLTWATTIGVDDPFAPTAKDKVKLAVKKLMHVRLRRELDKAKQVRAHAMAFRREAEIFYPTDVHNTAGCDDGLIAVQLMPQGLLHRISLGLYTKGWSGERIDADARWPKI